MLVAPLDWGLGHATRCIPIINELIQQGAQVIVAASGLAEESPVRDRISPWNSLKYRDMKSAIKGAFC